MLMNKEEQKLIPKLRFPEFDSEYQDVGFSELGKIKIGLTHKPDYIDSGIPFLSSKNISNGYIDFKDINYISEEKFLSMPDSTKPKVGDILFTRVGSNLGNPIIVKEDVEFGIFVSLGFFRVNRRADNKYVRYWMDSDLFWKQVEQKVAGGAKMNLNSTWLKEFRLAIPTNKKEQQKIANCLSSLDNLITAETEKLDLLKDHKKGLLQQLFPKQGETKPQFRFKEFQNDGDWIPTTLEKCLDYLQPTPYLVESTDYDDKFETPVLTAGKTFVLGYTDEKEGIFNENLPVIIFDDFTTASKFVDFSFKVKSSAMKILLAKDDNDIKFMFEAIQNLKFEVSTHKRHWISVYSKLKILKPKDPKEQQRIAKCLSSVDTLIEKQTLRIEQLQHHKKGLLQQLFPNII